MRVQTEFGVRFVVTGACHNTQANFYLLFTCNRRSVRLQFLGLGKLLLFLRPLRFNRYLPWVMRLHLVPHLLWLVAMVA